LLRFFKEALWKLIVKADLGIYDFVIREFDFKVYIFVFNRSGAKESKRRR
jgi:hypothetical protein